MNDLTSRILVFAGICAILLSLCMCTDIFAQLSLLIIEEF